MKSFDEGWAFSGLIDEKGLKMIQSSVSEC